ncbi:MAG: hypothetical protein Q9227_006981 [Pyrenula ochraceoflavens]
MASFAPHEDSVNAVREWLTSSGGIAKSRITHSDNKGWLAFDATVEEVEALIKAEYHQYEQPSNGKTFAACDQYHLPQHIREHVDYITPAVKAIRMKTSIQKRQPVKRQQASKSMASVLQDRGFGRPAKGDPISPPKQRPPPINMPHSVYHSNETANCDVAITPACIQALYRVPAGRPGRTVSPDNSFDGANAPVAVSNAGGESDLDLQLAYPIIYPQTITLYQTDDLFYSNSPNSTATGIFNTFLDAIDGSYCTYSAYNETGNDPVLDPTYPDPNPGGYKGPLQCGVYKPTPVISISYGEQEQDLPAYYQERQCNELTNVGATKVYPGRTVNDPESAVVDPPGMPYRSAFSSGGGFSNIFPIPSYQSAAVQNFFSAHDPPYPYYSGGQNIGANGGLYNRLGRGIPDVAANGDNIAVYNRGAPRLSGGTSASAPIFASIINRINEERLAAGKGTVGFINPVLYQNPGVLNDITNGTNPGCGTVGFESVEGWDPVTGLGTPDYPRMLNLFMGLD